MSTPRNKLLPGLLPRAFDVAVKSNDGTAGYGAFTAPGDKSIAQRAIFLCAIANGGSIIRNVPKCADIYSCINALKQLGVDIRWQNDGLIVSGVGLNGLKPVSGSIFMGNSATSTRILMSILAGYPFKTTITGNDLLSKRPMDWVASHLMRMGAKITYLKEPGFLPLIIEGKYPLLPVDIEGTVVSAQEKSAILFAGLYCNGIIEYRQICKTRDHTDRLLRYFGLSLHTEGNITQIEGSHKFGAKNVTVPGDISSAAFMLAAYLMRRHPANSSLRINRVGVNPTRTGFLKALTRMGVHFEYENQSVLSSEPSADIICKCNSLSSAVIEGNEFVQSLIDEIPLLSALAAFAEGTTVIRDCAELKDKDTNRIKTTSDTLRQFGVDIVNSDSEIIINGGRKLHAAGTVNSFCDHRIAMTSAVLGSCFNEWTHIKNCECAFVSYPKFFEDLSRFAQICIIPRD